MGIYFQKNGLVAHIKNDYISYVLEVIDNKYVVNRYFGQSIREYRESNSFQYYERSYNTQHISSVENLSFDDFPFEYPTRSHGDFRIPALSIIQDNGIDMVDLIFKEWRILKEKPVIKGLPSTFSKEGESETLEVICEDQVAKVRVYMYYTLFNDLGIIVRNQKIENFGQYKVSITNAKSLSVDLPAKEYDFLSLYGTHTREANIDRFRLHRGIQKIESARGTSSPQHQPFFALLSPNTSQEMGEVYAFHLIYSGCFVGEVEKDQFGNIRAQLGLNPTHFTWLLSSGETFETPEVVLNYSTDGLNGMSYNFHKLYKNHLVPQRFMMQERPILLNSWESMYYDVTHEKIDKQSTIAKELGIELFVLDDGWFRQSNDSKSSMGDWICNENKLPGGISKVADAIQEKGLKFGLWFEPEMISKNSHLYAQHPEWTLQIPGYSMIEGRNQYVLDLSRTDVQQYIIGIFHEYLKDGRIEYVKWDMNRPLTDVNSLALEINKKGEIWHRYVLGLYHVLKTITSAYPNVLFEGCSSGGARFDPGMLSYMPQIWTSDNTDAFDRMTIQTGYSLLYPPVTMGAHISVTPNHQTGRITPMNTRYQVARLFNIGYELDLSKCETHELEEIRHQIAEIKRNRTFIQNGDFFRHDVPNDNYVMWSTIDSEKTEAIIVIFQKLYDPIKSHGLFKLNYLNPDFDYLDVTTNKVYGGDELMNVGLSVPLVKKDFYAFEFHLKKIN